jgi:hypothetical protein
MGRGGARAAGRRRAVQLARHCLRARIRQVEARPESRAPRRALRARRSSALGRSGGCALGRRARLRARPVAWISRSRVRASCDRAIDGRPSERRRRATLHREHRGSASCGGGPPGNRSRLPHHQPADVHWLQDHLSAQTHFYEQGFEDSATVGVAVWDSSAGIFLMTNLPSVPVDRFVNDELAIVWTACEELVTRVGGRGETYVSVLASGGRRMWPQHPSALLPDQRPASQREGPSVSAARADIGPLRAQDRPAVQARLARELQRAAGRRAPEPATEHG